MIPLAVAIALGTLLSEDLACIAAGLMVARGELRLSIAIAAAFSGILVGDLLLYGAGRWIGRSAIERGPMRRLLAPHTLMRAARWMERRGPAVVIATRFLPGTRLPTYVAAGALRTSFPRFALWFGLAAAVWTPLLVGFAALAGTEALARVTAIRYSAAVWMTGGILLWLVVRKILPLTTWRGRRLALSTWRRATRWEFWPAWLVYAPVLVWIVILGVRHRALTLFTAANPGIPAGGIVGESKAAILEALRRGGAPVARFCKIEGGLAIAARCAAASRFLKVERLPWPVVVKPDIGERGRGVRIVASDVELHRALGETDGDVLVQEYVAGPEFGVFYYRFPSEAEGRIFSITEKQLPEVVADGASTVERLVLGDARGVCMARFHLARLAARLDEVPEAGTRIPLALIGNHCRGAVFLDGARHGTNELVRAIDRASRGFPGFNFGRFDVRTASLEAFRAGHFTILELNGVTSEAAHIYDPKSSLLAGWRTLLAQWRIAFEIGAANRDRGVEPLGTAALVRLLVRGVSRPGSEHVASDSLGETAHGSLGAITNRSSSPTSRPS